MGLLDGYKNMLQDYKTKVVDEVREKVLGESKEGDENSSKIKFYLPMYVSTIKSKSIRRLFPSLNIIEKEINENFKKNTSIFISGYKYYIVNTNSFIGEGGKLQTNGDRSMLVTYDTKVSIQILADMEKIAHKELPYDQNHPNMIATSDPMKATLKTFEVATKYGNCDGNCYAVTMARVNKAYQNLGVKPPLDLNLDGVDYAISSMGGNISLIPDKYWGYGVVGALVRKGYGTLIKDEDIRQGLLSPGAIVQVWDCNKANTFERVIEWIKNLTPEQQKDTRNYPYSGHSFVFRDYVYDDEQKKIIAMRFDDYRGMDRYSLKASPFDNLSLKFAACNLIDE